MRNLDGSEGVDGLIESFQGHPSNLLRHEICYALGQTRNPRALEFLAERLSDRNENGMVRHEAAEALGAIGDIKSLTLLEQFVDDPMQEVAQTCELAVARLKWSVNEKKQEGDLESKSKYLSVDPAPPPPMETSVEDMRACMLNESLSMFERYRALFGLRNEGSPVAISALCEALLASNSALMRHEIAYVLGQMQSKLAAEAVSRALANQQEHEMVRHEAAEALGCIAPETQKEVLNHYSNDPNDVVAHSCQVALAMYDNNFIYV